MTVRFITLICTMVTHYIIASSTASPCSTCTLSSFHGIHSFLPTMAFIHLVLTWSCTASAARLVVFCTKHVFHSWKKGAVLILKEGVRKADRCQGYKAIALLILVCFLHWADRVKLVLV